MRFWRIAGHQYALDRSGTGVALSGGRWNSTGVAALYGGTTIAICALEKFVHLDGALLPPQMLIAIDVPDECPVHEPGLADLPMDWDALPMSLSAQKYGSRWLGANGQLLMRMPSVIINEEKNIVLNPLHADYDRVTLSVIRSFSFDPRMHK